MRFGSPFASPCGSTENMVAALSCSRNGGTLLVDATTLAGLGAGNWALYVNSCYVGARYAADGAEMLWSAPAKPGLTNQRIALLRLGRLAYYDLQRVARTFDTPTSQRVTVTWNWADLGPVAAGVYNDGGHTSNWVLACQFADGMQVPFWPTRISFTVSCVFSGATATVTLSNRGGAVFTGTGPKSSTVSLKDSTGATVGSVDLDSSGADITAAMVYFRWPKSVDIIRGVAGVSTTKAGTVLYTQAATGAFTETADLSGSYFYALRPTSDTGEQHAMPTTGGAAAPVAVPAAPTALAYKDGNYTNTRVQFTASTTVGATYNLYWRPIGATYLDLVTPAVSGAASPLTLPAVSGYPGTVTVIVRAVKSGVEEGNAASLSIEYSASGAVVVARPNRPTLSGAVVTAGTTVTVTAQYPTTGQAVAAATINLYSRMPGFMWGVPLASASLGAANQYGLRLATITGTLPAGLYEICATAVTAGGVESAYSESQILTTDTSAPALLTPSVYVTRG